MMAEDFLVEPSAGGINTTCSHGEQRLIVAVRNHNITQHRYNNIVERES